MNFLLSKEFFKRLLTSCGLLFCLGGAYLHSVALFSFTLLIILLVILFFEWPNLIPGSLFKYTLISLFYPITPFMSIIYLNYRYHYDCLYLPLYPFLIAWSADTFGYFVGKAMGKHKMCPTISPGKSWEGFIGSWGGIMLLNLIIIPKITIYPFNYYPYLTFLLGSKLSWSIIIGYSLVQTIIAFAGGFFLSILKRRSGLKDAGTVLPGHGGFLDRFDSVLPIVILTWITILLRNH